MLTKNDLNEIAKLIKANIEPTHTEIKAVNTHNSRIEMKLIDMEGRFEKNLKQWKSELFDKIDKILGRVKTSEEENVILRSREETRNEIGKKLETRLKGLESIHPNGRHQYS